MGISSVDTEYMKLAIDEAIGARDRGDLPIGAVLTIDGSLVGKTRNSQVTNEDWLSHAELSLIRTHATIIKKSIKDSKKVELYTTLEPCLMCFGTSVHTRISRIIYACPDPAAGATHIDPITEWYSGKWPTIDGGIMREESYNLFVEYMRSSPETWKNVLPLYEEMHKRWQTT